MKTISGNSILKKRKGFAIVLVAALAGLIFLLGASLVVMSQMQSAASQYDQRLRLARDNARASLEMALGDLQRYAGRDQVVTYMSDVYRPEVGDDFNSPNPAGTGLDQAFWTAAYDGTDETWLVTRPMASDFSPNNAGDEAQPDDLPASVIMLVGASTAEPDSGFSEAVHEVRVPKEKLITSGVIGYDSVADKTVGHYAYWVGDMGVKASYAVYDRNNNVTHDSYEDVEGEGPNPFRRRLEQMRMSKPSIDFFDATLDYTKDAIDVFVSDFQLRDRAGESGSSTIFGDLVAETSPPVDAVLTPNEVLNGFHDFTGLSKGLLTSTATGGLKSDLSGNYTLENAAYDDDLRHYANLPFVLTPSVLEPPPVSALERAYDVAAESGNIPAIHPVLTQFNLRASLRVEYGTGLEENIGSLKVAYNVAFEFWNPYTSSLNQERNLRAVVRGLPNISGQFTGIGTDTPFSLNLDEPEEVSIPSYVIAGNSLWSPGEIRVYSGEGPSLGPLAILDHDNYGDATIESEQTFNRENPDTSNDKIVYSFTDPDDVGLPLDAEIVVELYHVAASGDELLGTYSLLGLKYGAPPSVDILMDNAAQGNTSFGFAWELTDDVLVSSLYDPVKFEISSSSLSGFFENATSPTNTATPFQDSISNLLGFESVASPPEADDESHRIPLLEIPRQELTSVSMLRSMSGNNSIRIGEPLAPRNHLFDEAFFSTIPRDAYDANNNPYTLPNSFYEVSEGANIGDMQGLLENTSQNLFVRGAFNINSTSIRAWEAVLKGIDIDSWTYVDPAGTGGETTITPTSMYQFFNYPQSAEETYSGVYGSGQADKQKSYRQGVIMLTDTEESPQIFNLAEEIVSGIRTRIQGSGPFISIEDFLDSGVLNTAIADSGVNPSGIIVGSPGYLTQATIMNAIAPYISARSDTFVIRAYGDSVNPADENEVWSRAYCEAIVQRVHAKHATDTSSGGVMTPTNAVAGEFGRQFEVVAFRWLSPSDI